MGNRNWFAWADLKSQSSQKDRYRHLVALAQKANAAGSRCPLEPIMSAYPVDKCALIFQRIRLKAKTKCC
jgi:hypothetical protein